MDNADYVQRLEAIEKDCQVDGWDSYGAHPVTPRVVEVARWLCESLDVIPTNRGGIQIDVGREAVTLELDALARVASFCVDIEELNEWIATKGAPTGNGRSGHRDCT